MRQYVCAVAVALGSALLLAGPVHAEMTVKSEGLASWYKMGTQTANGESYDPMGITAAHPSLPFDTKVRVTNPDNGKSVVVRINDRGPFTGNRIIDLSKGAARALEMIRAGVARVKIEVVGNAASPEVAAVPTPKPDVTAAEAEPVANEAPLRLMAEQRINVSSR